MTLCPRFPSPVVCAMLAAALVSQAWVPVAHSIRPSVARRGALLRLQADSPWAEPDPWLRQEQIQLRRQLKGVSSVVNDPAAQAFRELYGDEGDDLTLDLNSRALRDRRRLQWILRPLLIGAAVHAGWSRPVAATGATRLAWMVHAAWPAAVVAGTAARSWRRPAGAPPPRANASLVLSTQHVLSEGVLAGSGLGLGLAHPSPNPSPSPNPNPNPNPRRARGRQRRALRGWSPPG